MAPSSLACATECWVTARLVPSINACLRAPAQTVKVGAVGKDFTIASLDRSEAIRILLSHGDCFNELLEGPQVARTGAVVLVQPGGRGTNTSGKLNEAPVTAA